MPLNYRGTEQIGNLGVWSFEDENGQPFRTEDPMLALELGAPVGAESAPVPGAPASPPPSPAPGQNSWGAFTGTPDLGSGTRGTVSVPDPMAGNDMPPGLPDMRLANRDVPQGDTRTDAVPPGADPRFYTPPTPAGGSGWSPSDVEARAGKVTEARQAPSFDANEALDFGDEAPAQGPGTGGSVQMAANPEAPAGPHPLFGAVASEMPSRYRYSPGSPGGWMDQSRAFKGTDPKEAAQLMQRQDQLTAARINTAVARSELDEQTLKARRTELLKQTLADEKEIDAQKAVIAERESYKNQERQRIDSEAQKIQNMEVDADRIFADDPGAKFIAALAIGLGQFGASINGGPNTAYNIINTSIERDIEEQKRQIDEARLANEKADNALQRKLDEGLDPRFAEEELRLMQNRYAAGYMQLKEVRQQLSYLGVDAADVIGLIEQDGIDRHAGLMDKVGVQASQKYSAPRAGGMVEDPNYWNKRETAIGTTLKVGEATGDIEPREIRIERAKQEMQGGNNEKTIYWQGQPVGQAARPEEATKIRKQSADTEYMLNSVGEIKRLAQDWSSMSPTDRAEASARLADLRLTAKGQALYELGVLAGPDMEILEQVASNPNEFFALEGSATRKLDVLGENLIGKMNTSLRSQGINNTVTYGQ